MKLLISLTIGVFTALNSAVWAAPAANEPTAAGLWEQVDESSGKAESWFRITERNGVYEGAIVKIFFKPGEDQNWVCDKCEGAERGAPVLGMTLIKGMRRKGDAYEDGTIMDPRDGSVYRALMRLYALSGDRAAALRWSGTHTVEPRPAKVSSSGCPGLS